MLRIERTGYLPDLYTEVLAPAFCWRSTISARLGNDIVKADRLESDDILGERMDAVRLYLYTQGYRSGAASGMWLGPFLTVYALGGREELFVPRVPVEGLPPRIGLHPEATLRDFVVAKVGADALDALSEVGSKV